MFGLKQMHQKRERLYLRTQVLEKRAKLSRDNAVDNILEKATSPTGLIASFVLGASTQLDITRKVRKNLLNGASRDVLSFLMTQVSVYMANSTAQASTSSESMTSESEDRTPSSEEDTSSSATPFVASKDSCI
ncbi:MAG: hypothetical protein KJ609_13830 [Gammaproteobacteria bacterium]|nr:hypothetical protein [Gammaproteobacteria bacterium]MBU1468865.1 hypothetical protein [Gammaproteobacteria bacterium]MBU2021353.1 hypothetical protein [Gammaproteobacteria bacterium]MBU2319625.1 hypothetical protein [Gammaproteobacteria bacterium]MBU2412879.1 hypothetical protein [Gammaproteobacteria bacterium]